MNEEVFLTSLKAALDLYESNLSTKEETIKFLQSQFVTALEPVSGAKKHLELFIYRVKIMRGLQQEFFDGRRSALAQAKAKEAQVDAAIGTMLGKLGYSIEEIERKAEQKALF